MPESSVALEPPAEIIFRRRVSLVGALAELWTYRELLRALAERELRARYKQAILGFLWAVITPVVLMIVFTLFVKRVADIDTGGAPYPLFTYLGLLPWTFFSSSVSRGGQSLLTNATLLNKVYSPREVFPLASVIVAGLDLVIQVAVLGVLFGITGYAPKATSYWVPLLLIVMLVFTIAVTLLFSGTLVYVRDVRYALPLLLQLGLFATPVAWGIDVVPSNLQPIYAALNPLAPVIEGFRSTVLMGEPPDLQLLAIGAISSFVLLFVGYRLFKRLETSFADAA